MMIEDCPRCKHPLVLTSDDDCSDYGCSCGDGIVSSFTCSNCNTHIVVTMDCKDTEEEEE